MNRLVINLDNVIAWFEDEENKTVTVVTDGITYTAPTPDETLLLKDGKIIMSYLPNASGNDLMNVIGQTK